MSGVNVSACVCDVQRDQLSFCTYASLHKGDDKHCLKQQATCEQSKVRT